MSEFKNVNVVKKANVYFNGAVTSRTIYFTDGSKKTLGIMNQGDYEFNTGDKEIIEVLGGEMTILLPGEAEWKTFKEGESFEVSANSSFKLKIKSIADYCCSYIKE